MPILPETHLEPRSLEELLKVPVEDIQQVDIGRANLLCAEGLPGAENLDVEEHVGRLDAWAERVRRMTEQHLPGFASIAAHFDHSEAKWRLCAMAKLLNEECGVGYNQSRIESEPDWTDSQDLLIHGMTGKRRTGTCPSLPVFFVAIGRRLGYPMYLSKAPAHSFSRWDAAAHTNLAWQDCFNIEFHGHVDFHEDEHYYDWPVKWPSAARERHRQRHPSMTYIESLPASEEFAHSLCQRAVCLEAAGRLVEAVNTYDDCRRYDQRWQGYFAFAKRTLRSRAEQVMRSMGFEPEQVRLWAIDNQLRQSHFPLSSIALHAGSLANPTGQQAAMLGTPPHNFEGIVTSILHLTCEGTSIAPSFDLLLPQPPEQKVEPYGSHSKTA